VLLLVTFDRIEAELLEQKTARFPQVWAVSSSTTISYFIFTALIVAYSERTVNPKQNDLEKPFQRENMTTGCKRWFPAAARSFDNRRIDG